MWQCQTILQIKIENIGWIYYARFLNIIHIAGKVLINGITVD